ncbi:MAG: outer membrane beta-barrel protein [Bacteroidales bacterium]|nr:outer membrane beta-barrel protein [Bacteroidales bacterium]
MKRFFVAIIAMVMLAGATGAAAQGHRHGYHRDVYTAADGLGITFGYVHSAYRISDWATDEVVTSDGLDGFELGITKDFPIVDRALYLQTGLAYTYQNDSRNISESGIRVVGDWDEHYLNIPIKIKYEVPVMENLSVFVMGGPSIVAGISSSVKYRARVSDSINAAISYDFYNGKVRTNDSMPDFIEGLIESQFPETRYRRADVQLGASAGVRFFEILEAQIGYDWGLVNKYKGETLDDLKMRRQQLYISVGLRF